MLKAKQMLATVHDAVHDETTIDLVDKQLKRIFILLFILVLEANLASAWSLHIVSILSMAEWPFVGMQPNQKCNMNVPKGVSFFLLLFMIIAYSLQVFYFPLEHLIAESY